MNWGANMAHSLGGRRSEMKEDHGQRAYKGIRRMLYNKELVPGQKISSRELADRFDMSLTPVIQALKYMEFQAFVRHEPNRGYYLTPSSLQELEEIYDLRYLLEPSLIPNTVRHLDKDGAKGLKAAMEAHFLAHREGYLQERIFKNVQFHLTLASLSNRPTQIRILRNIFDLLILKYGGNQGTEDSMTSVDDEHRKTFDCVVSGDVEGAKKVLSRHVMNVKNQVIERFEKIQQEREMPEFS